MSSEIDLGDEVITEYADDATALSSYADDSDYVSSEEHYTPFPSLTLSKKIELEKYIHNGEITYNISTFSEPDIPEQNEQQTENQQTEQYNQEISKQYENNGCCLLL